MKPSQIIPLFDQYLLAHRKKFEAIVIGAGALSLLGVISRETKDVDVIDPEIPKDIKSLSQEFAKQTSQNLIQNWINNGPASMRDKLPIGWQKRLQKIYSGKALTLFTLSRVDLLATKLQGLGDRGERGPDWNDIKAMKPTLEEMDKALRWAEQQDANPSWPEHVRRLVDTLMKEMVNGI